MELNIAFLSLGSNIGDRLNFLNEAIKKLNKKGKVIRSSKVYETAAWGFEAEENFYNICLEFHTCLTTLELLHFIQEIEFSLGRIRTDEAGYKSRPIDIDIIFFDDIICETSELTIPHPHYTKRRFVLAPLNELVPKLIDPKMGKSIETMLDELKDDGFIKSLEMPVIC
jgi:2-amino-4-hydroxy-6-hydroxymethyldihydropteridine diphosphokinase